LALFARRPGRVFAREEIAVQALRDEDASPRAVDVHVVNLRRKLDRPQAPRIATVYGIGYRLDGPAQAEDAALPDRPAPSDGGSIAARRQGARRRGETA